MNVEQKEFWPRVLLIDQIRESLKNDPRVFVAGEFDNQYNNTYPNVLQYLKIYVAPVKPIYDPKELDDFMLSLIPGVERINIFSHEHEGDSLKRKYNPGFDIGSLCYYETLGIFHIKKITTVEVFDKEMIQDGDYAPVYEEKEDKLREIEVKVYPNAVFAKELTEYYRKVDSGLIKRIDELGRSYKSIPLELFTRIKNDPKYNS